MSCNHDSIEFLELGYYCKNKFCRAKLSVVAFPKSGSLAGANWKCDEECACPRNETTDAYKDVPKYDSPEALGDEEDEETTQESIEELKARIDDLEKILSDLHSILDKHFRPF